MPHAEPQLWYGARMVRPWQRTRLAAQLGRSVLGVALIAMGGSAGCRSELKQLGNDTRALRPSLASGDAASSASESHAGDASADGSVPGTPDLDAGETVGLRFDAGDGGARAVNGAVEMSSDASATTETVAAVTQSRPDASTGQADASDSASLAATGAAPVGGGPRRPRPRAAGGATDTALADAGAPSDSSAPERAADWVVGVALELGAGADTTQVEVPPQAIVIDGQFSDWDEQSWVRLNRRVDVRLGLEPDTGERDFSAALALRWTKAALYVAVVVVDDVLLNTNPGSALWEGDSVQLAFDTGGGHEPYDWEYGFAQLGDLPSAHAWSPNDADLTTQMTFAVQRFDGVTAYEIALDPSRLGVSAFPAAGVRFSLAVNEADVGSRTLALELAAGIVESPKSDAEFVPLIWLDAGN